MNIEKTIARFIKVNKERNALNMEINNHYTPLLTEAAKNGDRKEFNRLVSEMPDCPFQMTAIRIEILHDLKEE